MIATLIGGGSIMGTIETGFVNGITPLIGLLGFPLQFLLVAFIITPRRINMLTLGDLFEGSYGKGMRIFVGLMVVFFNLSILTTVMHSLGFMLGAFTIPYAQIFISACLLFFIMCSCFGGIVSVIWFSVLQCVFMIIALSLGLLLMIYYYESLGEFLARIPTTHWQFSNKYSYIKILSMFIGVLLGNALMPPMLQTINMAKSKEQAKAGYIIASLFIAFGIVFLIFCGMSMATLIDAKGGIFHNFLCIIPLWLKIFIVTGLLTAMLSSLNTFLNVAVVAFVHDILKPLHIKMNDLKAARIFTFIFGSICIIITLFMESSLFGMKLFVYQFWGPLFLAPLLGVYFKKTISKKAFFINTFLTLLAMGLWHFSGLEKTTEIRDLVIGLAVNFVLYGIARTMKT